MTAHRPPCHSDQEHNVVSLLRQEVDDDYRARFEAEREEEERLAELETADWAPGEFVEAWGL
jgi:hypothetical protein